MMSVVEEAIRLWETCLATYARAMGRVPALTQQIQAMRERRP